VAGGLSATTDRFSLSSLGFWCGVISKCFGWLRDAGLVLLGIAWCLVVLEL